MEQAEANSDAATPVATPAVIDRLEIFGPPPLLEGEDCKAYDTLLARVSGATKPKDIIEEIWGTGHRRLDLGNPSPAPLKGVFHDSHSAAWNELVVRQT